MDMVTLMIAGIKQFGVGISLTVVLVFFLNLIWRAYIKREETLVDHLHQGLLSQAASMTKIADEIKNLTLEMKISSGMRKSEYTAIQKSLDNKI